MSAALIDPGIPQAVRDSVHALPTKELFLLKGGSHVDQEGRMWNHKPGVRTIIESDAPLDKMFSNKFHKVGTVLEDGSEELSGLEIFKPAKAKVADSLDLVDLPKKEEVLDLGLDVSETFPIAKKNDLKVFQKDSSYFVVDRDMPSTPMNHDALITPAQVNRFIKETASKV